MNHVRPQPSILNSLQTVHPRLLADAGAFDHLRALRQSDPLIDAGYLAVRRRADQLLDAPISTYDIPDGLRLLHVSRCVLDRTLTLGLVWRIERADRYADRLWRELAAVCAFPDWNPRHFLDTAEMTAAVAVGYDWLFDHWTADHRALLRRGIVTHGLLAAKKNYENRDGFTQFDHNWNQVCNGGIAMGALAVADDEPELAELVIQGAVETLPRAMACYGPDGAWAEGPVYWAYATQYTAFILASLQTSLASDFGLSDIPGFSFAGDMPIYFTSPSGRPFNFADCPDHINYGPAMFYLARRFNAPRFSRFRLSQLNRDSQSFHPLDLLWYDPQLAHAAANDNDAPTARYFRHAEVASARSAWNDPLATFFACKAGSNAASHSNLDLGSFILDVRGRRFAADLGPDDYNLPGYFDFSGPRWRYYRMRAEAHNTLVVNPSASPDQNVRASAVISDFHASPDRTALAIDLTAAYADCGARQVHRSFAFTPDALTIRDAITLEKPGEIWWFWHTQAQVALSNDGRTATLSRHGGQMTVTLQSPDDARFIVMDALPLATSPHPQGQNPNNGAVVTNSSNVYHHVAVGTLPVFGPPDPDNAIRKLAVRLVDVRRATIEVCARF